MAAVENVESRGRATRTQPAIIRVQRLAILELVRAGAPPGTAAVKCGVPRRTHEDWLRRGRQADGPEPCKRYASEIEQAVEEWKYGRIQAVEAAEEGDWRAAMALLERRFPKEFGQRKQVDASVQVQVQPMFDGSKLTLDEQRQLRDLLAKAAPDAEDPALSDSARPALELVEGEGFIEVAE